MSGSENLRPMTAFEFHSDMVLGQWQRLSQLLSDQSAEPISIDGQDLDISQVVSIARYSVRTCIDAQALNFMQVSHNALQKRLGGGDIIYGVNTGFGGTADTRTKETERLQRVLIRELHYGILLPGARDPTVHSLHENVTRHRYKYSQEHSLESTYLPWPWIRAAILIRINSLIKGCSGVRSLIVERLQDLLRHNIIPMVPLRGSISASGDLSPLSYIAGVIQGNSTIRILSNTEENLYADVALSRQRLEPVTLQAKEGLAIVNGTAISTAAGALALHDAHGLAILSQILTAMSVEALIGTLESFHPFFAEARPHPGQIEAAQNIRAFLDGSQLAKVYNETEASLRQDRYSIRTATQWVGPVLEDLLLSHQQIWIECNSATDNPLVSQEGNLVHGGNFQAKAMTAAMEKARQGIQSIGRMLFTQCSEIINPATSRGLPPNLVAEDPSSSFIFKGTDLNIAALQAELGFIANPVNHVQTAEMGNQSLNSLALIAARYTHTGIDILSQLMAFHLLALCQALDLRAMHIQFLTSYRSQFEHILSSYDCFQMRSDNVAVADDCWSHLLKQLDATVNMDAKERFPFIAKSLRSTLLDHIATTPALDILKPMSDITQTISTSLHDTWCLNREAYLDHGDATPFLGRASRRMYEFVRSSLGIPFLYSSRIKTPKPNKIYDGQLSNEGGSTGIGEAPTVGSYNSIVYHAIRDSTLIKVAMDILEDARK